MRPILFPILFPYVLSQFVPAQYSPTSITVYHTVIYTTTIPPASDQSPQDPTSISARTTAIITVLQPRALEPFGEYPRDGALVTGSIISHLTASPSYSFHTAHPAYWSLTSNTPIGESTYVPPPPPPASLDPWSTALTILTSSYIATTVLEYNMCLLPLAPEMHYTFTTREYVTLMEPIATEYPDTIVRRGVTRYYVSGHAFANGYPDPSIVETSAWMDYTVTRMTTMVRIPASPTETTMVTVTGRSMNKAREKKRWETETTSTAFPSGWGPQGSGCGGRQVFNSYTLM